MFFVNSYKQIFADTQDEITGKREWKIGGCQLMKLETKLTRFGFSFDKGGAHQARTMMFQDLTTLIEYVDNPEALKLEWVHEQNQTIQDHR